MVKKKGKDQIFTPDTFFLLTCMNKKKKFKKTQKKFENSYRDTVIFCFATLAYYFFFILHFCKSLNMYFFCK